MTIQKKIMKMTELHKRNCKRLVRQKSITLIRKEVHPQFIMSCNPQRWQKKENSLRKWKKQEIVHLRPGDLLRLPQQLMESLLPWLHHSECTPSTNPNTPPSPPPHPRPQHTTSNKQHLAPANVNTSMPPRSCLFPPTTSSADSCTLW